MLPDEQQEGLTRSLAAFSRFLEAASFSQGSVLNRTAVARAAGCARVVTFDRSAAKLGMTLLG